MVQRAVEGWREARKGWSGGVEAVEAAAQKWIAEEARLVERIGLAEQGWAAAKVVAASRKEQIGVLGRAVGGLEARLRVVAAAAATAATATSAAAAAAAADAVEEGGARGLAAAAAATEEETAAVVTATEVETSMVAVTAAAASRRATDNVEQVREVGTHTTHTTPHTPPHTLTHTQQSRGPDHAHHEGLFLSTASTSSAQHCNTPRNQPTMQPLQQGLVPTWTQVNNGQFGPCAHMILTYLG